MPDKETPEARIARLKNEITRIENESRKNERALFEALVEKHFAKKCLVIAYNHEGTGVHYTIVDYSKAKVSYWGQDSNDLRVCLEGIKRLQVFYYPPGSKKSWWPEKMERASGSTRDDYNTDQLNRTIPNILREITPQEFKDYWACASVCFGALTDLVRDGVKKDKPPLTHQDLTEIDPEFTALPT